MSKKIPSWLKRTGGPGSSVLPSNDCRSSYTQLARQSNANDESNRQSHLESNPHFTSERTKRQAKTTRGQDRATLVMSWREDDRFHSPACFTIRSISWKRHRAGCGQTVGTVFDNKSQRWKLPATTVSVPFVRRVCCCEVETKPLNVLEAVWRGSIVTLVVVANRQVED